MTQATLINLHPNEYSQELHYCPFAVNLNRCAGSCNTLDDLSNKVCVPNEAEDLNLHAFNMITGINESRILKQHMSCKCECKFMVENVTRIKIGITIIVGVSVKMVSMQEVLVFSSYIQ